MRNAVFPKLQDMETPASLEKKLDTVRFPKWFTSQWEHWQLVFMKFCHAVTCYFTEWIRLEGTTRGDVIQPACWSRFPYSMLFRNVSRLLWSISRDTDTTTSLGILFQCWVTLRVKFLLTFRWNFLGSSFCHCLLSYCLAPPRRAWLHSLDTLTATDRHWWGPFCHFFLRLNKPRSSAFPHN